MRGGFLWAFRNALRNAAIPHCASRVNTSIKSGRRIISMQAIASIACCRHLALSAFRDLALSAFSINWSLFDMEDFVRTFCRIPFQMHQGVLHKPKHLPFTSKEKKRCFVFAGSLRCDCNRTKWFSMPLCFVEREELLCKAHQPGCQKGSPLAASTADAFLPAGWHTTPSAW